ncbi:acetyl-CoA carboxylase biotin carboxyl carrier protein [Altererythrobacter atlanticus]|uniref:Biotin carboxyl carrier protein of acetyl-CoA carboxylase n=1 Tax=Croceibacterium atlanticum TaxID=1267766 RepID=A0A0F7KZG3_9SPHN|nr:biotin/lipoyl-containing protein [Croceibacterium atlanticum]AKH44225.1 Biotin carboxyl carrier protein of acetyl-CoA carboxylase [Croceibacterium atlanticum]MBB5732536.1 acetyl-CoA carboxylase biotin carboxyl carrier protein [Croceibacterium atlanticum]
MSLSRKDVEEIMQLLEGSRFDRLALEMDGVKLELVREGAGLGARPSTGSGRAEPPRSPEPAPTPAHPEPVEGQPPQAPAPARGEGLVEIRSPLLGVFYRAPKPGEPPFVEVGSRVEEDTVIGIIEVMKLMNSARAGVCGEVVEILGTNGEMVEHGEALMLVRPD